MAELILHHYPNSPFAEKIRLIFGLKKLVWRSVIIPVIMPKPELMPLTGGYRRTPVLQIGRDIYCDTALIADVLERLQPTPSLYPTGQEGLARTLAQWADSTLFWTAIGYAFQPAGVQGMFAGAPPEAIKAFGADRAAMRGNAPRMRVPEATGQLMQYLQRIEAMLGERAAWLLGAQPTLADFSVYHALWYVRRATAVAAILDATPGVLAWMDRMAAIGHHQFTGMESSDALAIARRASDIRVDRTDQTAAGLDAQETFFDCHGAALGDVVAIMPTDYGLDPVEGRLIRSTATGFALERDDPRAGTVVVHFPRTGFQLKKI